MNKDRAEELRWALKCYMNVVLICSFIGGFVSGMGIMYAIMK